MPINLLKTQRNYKLLKNNKDKKGKKKIVYKCNGIVT